MDPFEAACFFVVETDKVKQYNEIYRYYDQYLLITDVTSLL